MSELSLESESPILGSILTDCVEVLSSGGESITFPFRSLVPCSRLMKRVKRWKLSEDWILFSISGCFTSVSKLYESLFHYFEQRWFFDEQSVRVDLLQVDKQYKRRLEGSHPKFIGVLKV